MGAPPLSSCALVRKAERDRGGGSCASGSRGCLCSGVDSGTNRGPLGRGGAGAAGTGSGGGDFVCASGGDGTLATGGGAGVKARSGWWVGGGRICLVGAAFGATAVHMPQKAKKTMGTVTAAVMRIVRRIRARRNSATSRFSVVFQPAPRAAEGRPVSSRIRPLSSRTSCEKASSWAAICASTWVALGAEMPSPGVAPMRG